MNIFPLHTIPKKIKAKTLEYIGATFLGTVTQVETEKPVVALTFDGGPDPQWTPQYLAILRKYDVPASFFVIGKYVHKHTEIVEDMHREGHVICNHSWDHPSFPLVNTKERRSQVIECEQSILPFLTNKIFRPPYCDQTWASRYDLRRLGYTVVTANLHAFDWEDRVPDWMAERLITSSKPGDIIMMHDAVCDQRYRSRYHSLKALDMFLKNKSKQFTFVTLPDLFKSGRPVLRNWVRQPDIERFKSYERVI